MVAINFDGMFDAFAALNEKEWKYDRNLSLGASEVFTCERMTFYKKNQYEVDDDHEADWGAARRGDVIENNVAVPAMTAILPEGAKLLYAGTEQETLKKGRLSATPDGLVVNAPADCLFQLGIPKCNGQFVTEFKSFDPRANIKEAKAVHIGQVQVQMGLIHELTEYRPEYAVIIYFNASILSDIRCFLVVRDPEAYEAAIYRAKRVYAANEPCEMLPEGKITGDCRLCDYTEECAVTQGETSPKEKKAVDPETNDILKKLARERDAADTIIKEETTNKKTAEEEIKMILREVRTKGVADDSYSVSLTWCKGKNSTDLLAMAEDGIDIEKYQKEGNGYDRLTVKIK